MPTTIHIPAPLMDAVDRRARALGLSRNRLIVRALEREITERSTWSPEFVERLRAVDDQTRGTVDDLVTAIRKARHSKRPPAL